MNFSLGWCCFLVLLCHVAVATKTDLFTGISTMELHSSNLTISDNPGDLSHNRQDFEMRSFWGGIDPSEKNWYVGRKMSIAESKSYSVCGEIQWPIVPGIKVAGGIKFETDFDGESISFSGGIQIGVIFEVPKIASAMIYATGKVSFTVRFSRVVDDYQTAFQRAFKYFVYHVMKNNAPTSGTHSEGLKNVQHKIKLTLDALKAEGDGNNESNSNELTTLAQYAGLNNDDSTQLAGLPGKAKESFLTFQAYHKQFLVRVQNSIQDWLASGMMGVDTGIFFSDFKYYGVPERVLGLFPDLDEKVTQHQKRQKNIDKIKALHVAEWSSTNIDKFVESFEDMIHAHFRQVYFLGGIGANWTYGSYNDLRCDQWAGDGKQDQFIIEALCTVVKYGLLLREEQASWFTSNNVKSMVRDHLYPSLYRWTSPEPADEEEDPEQAKKDAFVDWAIKFASMPLGREWDHKKPQNYTSWEAQRKCYSDNKKSNKVYETECQRSDLKDIAMKPKYGLCIDMNQWFSQNDRYTRNVCLREHRCTVGSTNPCPNDSAAQCIPNKELGLPDCGIESEEENYRRLSSQIKDTDRLGRIRAVSAAAFVGKHSKKINEVFLHLFDPTAFARMLATVEKDQIIKRPGVTPILNNNETKFCVTGDRVAACGERFECDDDLNCPSGQKCRTIPEAEVHCFDDSKAPFKSSVNLEFGVSFAFSWHVVDNEASNSVCIGTAGDVQWTAAAGVSINFAERVYDMEDVYYARHLKLDLDVESNLQDPLAQLVTFGKGPSKKSIYDDRVTKKKGDTCYLLDPLPVEYVQQVRAWVDDTENNPKPEPYHLESPLCWRVAYTEAAGRVRLSGTYWHSSSDLWNNINIEGTLIVEETSTKLQFDLGFPMLKFEKLEWGDAERHALMASISYVSDNLARFLNHLLQSSQTEPSSLKVLKAVFEPLKEWWRQPVFPLVGTKENYSFLKDVQGAVAKQVVKGLITQALSNALGDAFSWRQQAGISLWIKWNRLSKLKKKTDGTRPDDFWDQHGWEWGGSFSQKETIRLKGGIDSVNFGLLNMAKGEKWTPTLKDFDNVLVERQKQCTNHVPSKRYLHELNYFDFNPTDFSEAEALCKQRCIMDTTRDSYCNYIYVVENNNDASATLATYQKSKFRCELYFRTPQVDLALPFLDEEDYGASPVALLEESSVASRHNLRRRHMRHKNKVNVAALDDDDKEDIEKIVQSQAWVNSIHYKVLANQECSNVLTTLNALVVKHPPSKGSNPHSIFTPNDWQTATKQCKSVCEEHYADCAIVEVAENFIHDHSEFICTVIDDKNDCHDRQSFQPDDTGMHRNRAIIEKLTKGDEGDFIEIERVSKARAEKFEKDIDERLADSIYFIGGQEAWSPDDVYDALKRCSHHCEKLGDDCKAYNVVYPRTCQIYDEDCADAEAVKQTRINRHNKAKAKWTTGAAAARLLGEEEARRQALEQEAEEQLEEMRRVHQEALEEARKRSSAGGHQGHVEIQGEKLVGTEQGNEFYPFIAQHVCQTIRGRSQVCENNPNCQYADNRCQHRCPTTREKFCKARPHCHWTNKDRCVTLVHPKND